MTRLRIEIQHFKTIRLSVQRTTKNEFTALKNMIWKCSARVNVFVQRRRRRRRRRRRCGGG